MTGRARDLSATVEPAPEVDVGLTTYRRATYIEEAIESVLAQTFADWHLTVCDNGVGDSEVPTVIQPYLDDPRIRYAPTNDDLSLAANWTNALNQGTSAYVAVLNDDDRWHPDFLRARVEALETNRECGFAFSEWTVIDEHGTEVMKAPVRFPEGVLSQERLAHLFIRQNVVVPPAILLRRSACDAVGPFFDDAWQYCDWELWARIGARFPAYYLARQDNDFRRHATAYTFATRESPDQLLEMVDHLEALYSQHVNGFRLRRVDRARTRSHILLHAASDVHSAHGWEASGPTYRRALREFPPTIFSRISLAMIVKSILGRRGTRLVRSALGRLRGR